VVAALDEHRLRTGGRGSFFGWWQVRPPDLAASSGMGALALAANVISSFRAENPSAKLRVISSVLIRLIVEA